MKRSILISNYFLANFNPIIRILIISDMIILGADGLFGPIFALFIDNFIVDGNAAVAGISASIFLITKSIFQIPIANLIDRIRGEKDDYIFLVVFTFLMGIIPIAYLYISFAWQLYVIQFVFGLFTAMTFPSYMAIFTRHIDKHIDKHKEGTEWGVYFTLTDLTRATLAAMGGYLAISIGYHAVIIILTLLNVAGALLLLPLKKYIIKKR